MNDLLFEVLQETLISLHSYEIFSLMWVIMKKTKISSIMVPDSQSFSFVYYVSLSHEVQL